LLFHCAFLTAAPSGVYARRLCERAKTACADVELDRFTAHADDLLVHVGPERSWSLGGLALPSAGMTVADIPPKHGVLATHLTKS
jgi:hypothetical protein